MIGMCWVVCEEVHITISPIVISKASPTWSHVSAFFSESKSVPKLLYVLLRGRKYHKAANHGVPASGIELVSLMRA